jgi:hypothetical protein
MNVTDQICNNSFEFEGDAWLFNLVSFAALKCAKDE